ncbi:MAG: UDP-N-acetylmuramoyl-L-alanine--D-glutamate ligase [Deltaproteobacteria bacterium]|jgi:UDP-N-acetylmuramoylalanine--D-glutamate ligase|nr:UDP-N-acetylmuramoyl-L-alanine--D-glutamate ligase [Deltaproteobacteria bacterium]MCL5879533.1 UDP-N-acetylmuramoyl-L-alanine--D-glutamate ligase [Deltaproteobacteria bacterium]MDA8305088.1 UDP-N-acetylmuramoyl-L-alanine--D-glutamate ligase [Deltaproteobacteria bacterium]
MNTLILGYGKTGKAVYDYLNSRTNPGSLDRVFVYDDILAEGEINALNKAADLKVHKSPVFFNKTNYKVFMEKYCRDITLCVASPGIERNHNVISKLKEYNIPVYSEIEFAYKMLNFKEPKAAKIMAITGTNGKTTTTTICGKAINKAGLGKTTFVGGNLGVPFISGVKDFNDFILEISSFQLEWVYDFKPDIAVLLNVEDDHLDRYENFDEYRLTKYKLFKNLKHSDVAILNYDDYNSRILKGVVGSKSILFGLDENKCDAYFKEDAINLRFKDIIGFDAVIPLKNVKDKRKFVIYDMLAAACSLALFGVSPEAISSACAEYELLKHRVEYVGSVGDIEFYDDSKATNPAAVVSALESLKGDGEGDKDIVLILGGKDKGFNYECLIQPIKNSVKACVLIGETKNIIKDTFNGHVPLIIAGDMECAVKESFLYLMNDRTRSSKGIVLLSPASSSFDMFKDYNERGDAFKKCYEGLKEEA